jgi:hypothetical protein
VRSFEGVVPKTTDWRTLGMPKMPEPQLPTD